MATRKETAADGPTQAPSAGEVFSFQTEMQQLLHIIIHSLYSEREIFLRELISNASDAINRFKFRSLTETELRDADAELEITLEVVEDGKALVISDSGAGMTRDEAVRNLGTIARSGTLEFVKELSAADPTRRMDLIGQFGVGFYSVFMVAKRVVVDTCPMAAGEEPVRWVSEGEGQYTVLPGERTRRGTTIRVELKDDAAEFGNGARVEGIVRRYSNFIPHPIRLDGRRLNVQEAIWVQPKAEVTAEQHAEFYKFLTHGTEGPLATIQLSIDAPVQYRALLYVPPQLTNEVLYSPKGFGLELYANKVLIERDCQEVLPLYLRFMRGVVDTEDLPLNVSRESVQNNPLLARLRTSLTGRVLRELTTLADTEPETYATLWRQYGKVLKEGLPSDESNRERLLELLRFNSSACDSPDDLITLRDYVGRMQPEQEEIYYLSGASRAAIERNPALEIFRKKGLEVLYLTDQVDDFVMATLFEHDGKRLVSIDSTDLAALQTDDAAPAGEAVAGDALDGLIAFLKDALGEQVSDVRPSKRLVDSPAVLVSADGIPGNLQKVMRAMGQDLGSTPKVLEINPAHSLLRNLARMQGHTGHAEQARALAHLLYDNCMLVEGIVNEPGAMADRMQALLVRAAELEATQVGGTGEAQAEPKSQD